MRKAKIMFGCVLFLGLAAGMSASTFTISGGGLNGCGGSFGGGFGPESSSSLISDHFSGLCEFGVQTESAIAGPGLLGASVFNTLFGSGNASLGVASARFSGPITIVDPVNETVAVSMNLLLSGALDMGGLGGGSVIIGLTTPFGVGQWDLVHGSTGSIPIPDPGTAAVVTTPTIFLPTNTPFTLTIDLDLTAGAELNGFIDLDYSHTVSFPSSGPAFNVPSGLTVDAPELNVFDNRWVDPRPSTTTPEPATCGFVLGALLLTICRARKLRP